MGKYVLLDTINSSEDVRKLSFSQLEILASEVRQYLIEVVSNNGGHLAPNLGVVELTIALHKVFNTPYDSIVFDVSHQSYVHKILTGRRQKLKSIRTFGGISGFTNPNESVHDAFIAGHASTSISVALGLAKANSLKGEKDRTVVAVIGDGALTGGLAFEALNNAGRSKEKLIVVLNDNEMSISKNVGAMAKYLASIRTEEGYNDFKNHTESVLEKIPVVGNSIVRGLRKSKTALKDLMLNNVFFEDLGFVYLGPVNGHDIKTLTHLLENAKNLNKPVIIHAVTTKGKGYIPAETRPDTFHGISSFSINTGKQKNESNGNFSSEFGKIICNFAEKDKRICAITAAMKTGTGLDDFSQKYKDRFFDVGIAEEHGATFAAGLAKNGMKPVFAVYSTFLQRAYDNIIHDICILKLPVVLAVDRAGLVGEDGETHQGIFDVSFLNSIPNMKIYSPATYEELNWHMTKALNTDNCPVAVRYPRGAEITVPDKYLPTNDDFTYIQNSHEKKYLFVTYGRVYENVVNAIFELKKQNIDVSVLKINKLKPLNYRITDIIGKYKHSLFIEESLVSGGIGNYISMFLLNNNFKNDYKILGISDMFVKHGKTSELFAQLKLDTTGILDTFYNEVMEK